MDDETKEMIVRGVLLFLALVIAMVAIFVTIQIFTDYEIDLSFSPPNPYKVDLNPDDGVDRSVSFDIAKDSSGESGLPEESQYKDKTIDPYVPSSEPDASNLFRTPLVIYDDEEYNQNRIALVLIIMELLVIFAIYRRVDKNLRKS